MIRNGKCKSRFEDRSIIESRVFAPETQAFFRGGWLSPRRRLSPESATVLSGRGGRVWPRGLRCRPIGSRPGRSLVGRPVRELCCLRCGHGLASRLPRPAVRPIARPSRGRRQSPGFTGDRSCLLTAPIVQDRSQKTTQAAFTRLRSWVPSPA